MPPRHMYANMWQATMIEIEALRLVLPCKLTLHTCQHPHPHLMTGINLMTQKVSGHVGAIREKEREISYNIVCVGNVQMCVFRTNKAL